MLTPLATLGEGGAMVRRFTRESLEATSLRTIIRRTPT
jgi:hypothetical protein